MASDIDTIGAVLDVIGVPQTETNRQQMDVTLRAFKIFANRNAEYGDTWAQFDLADAAHHLRSKAARMEAQARMDNVAGPVALDSALDAIVYGGFAARHVLGLLPGSPE